MSFKYTQDQIIHKLNTSKENLEFVRWDGEYKRMNLSSAVMRCNKHNHEFTSKVTLLLYDNIDCPLCAEENRGKAFQKPDNELIESFKAARTYPEGTTFTRSDKRNVKGHKPFWNVYCPACASDEFGKAGVCDGIFTVRYGELMKGVNICRCVGVLHLNNEQWEYRIAKEAKQRGTGISLSGKITGSAETNRMIPMTCDEHGPFVISVRNFWYRKRGCQACAKSGFLQNRPAWLYVLQIAGEDNKFTGYGISNQPEIRIRTHITNLARKGFIILTMRVIQIPGEHAYAIETGIARQFGRYGQGVGGFKREATHSEHFTDVVKFVEESIVRLSGPLELLQT
jgi:hypothetical protein